MTLWAIMSRSLGRTKPGTRGNLAKVVGGTPIAPPLDPAQWQHGSRAVRDQSAGEERHYGGVCAKCGGQSEYSAWI